jgi:hypothetical protein
MTIGVQRNILCLFPALAYCSRNETSSRLARAPARDSSYRGVTAQGGLTPSHPLTDRDCGVAAGLNHVFEQPISGGMFGVMGKADIVMLHLLGAEFGDGVA